MKLEKKSLSSPIILLPLGPLDASSLKDGCQCVTPDHTTANIVIECEGIETRETKFTLSMSDAYILAFKTAL